MLAVTYKIEQPLLFPLDFKLANFAETRNHVGDYFEALTARITGARRCATDCTKHYCPDLHWHDSTFIECKSVGRNGHVIVYRGRLKKDEEMVASGNRLYYFIWNHSADCKAATSLMELHAALRRTAARLLIVPASVMRIEADKKKPRVLNTAYTKTGGRLGYGFKAGYGDGWCIRYRAIAAHCPHSAVLDVDGCPLTVRWTLYD